MTFSFNLVLGLFLLAPGFAAFAGLYHGSRLGSIQSPPPPPGSILALSIVTIGTLIAHLIGGTIFWGQDVVCGRIRRCIATDYDPDIYASLFDIAEHRSKVTGPQVLAILLDLSVLTVFAFMLARKTVDVFGGRASMKGLLFGWLADLAVPQTSSEAVLAYILSDVQDNGTVVGYEGVVANMTTNADKEITSILLTSCETFYLRVTTAGVVRREALRAAPIPQLYIDRSRIKNVAFERVRFEAGLATTPPRP